MIKIATDSGIISKSIRSAFNHFAKRFSEIFPIESPALLHGDLWSGNFMFSKNKGVYIFDPACYYGNREMDIAMTTLFGGFKPSFYHAYNQEFPLEKGWEDRIGYCNLYPLLVHANLFGSSYLNDVVRILNKH
jgi:fructosamine-3-kinase